MQQRDHRSASRRSQPTPRRDVLRTLGAVAGACAAVPLAGTGCSGPASPPSDDVVVPLAEVPPDGRTIVTWRERPVEVRRAGPGEVAARSLVCTHMSCVVRWNDSRARYECPCHEGVFDAAGRPVAGPPREPLASVPARLEGDRIRVGDGAERG